jgi:uncharacterized protein YdhG (YjbR/CyaY superfamily)
MKEYADIDQYIATFPEDTRTILEKIRATIRREAPDAEEAIRYGIPTFRQDGQNLVHFAAFNDHTGFYPTPSGIEKFARELSPYTTGKGTVRFPRGQPVPYDLIAEIVRFRVGEVEKIPAGKRSTKNKPV